MPPSLENYRVKDAERLVTPALLVYPEVVDANIQVTIDMAGGDPNRWRPHIKTAKIPYVISRLLHFGVKQFKCSTTLELAALARAGAPDVLLAMPVSGANAMRVKQLAEQHPGTRVSVLVENEAQLRNWLGSGIGIFLDLNPGMNRTGLDDSHGDEVRALARKAGSQFRGLHYYDGHVSNQETAFEGYTRLLKLVEGGEVITSGTPASPFALKFEGFRSSSFIHRISPGTVVYNDLQSLSQLKDYPYHPAVLVLSQVVSHPAPGVATCDAGHKAVGVDSGVPNCAVVGWPDLVPQKPSEEHLPLKGDVLPEVGELIYLLPKHVCPTVNNFDHAVFVVNGRITSLETVAARGHESPLVLEEDAVPAGR